MSKREGKTLEQLEKELNGDVPAKTPTKKREYNAVMLPVGLYEIQSSSGGRLPDCLQGRFTSSAKVEKLIAEYNLK